MNVVLYSALYGRYDRPKVVPPDLGVPAVMFTNDGETATLANEAGWVVMLDDRNSGLSSMMRHKWFKLHPMELFPHHDASLWIDGSMTITVDNYVDRCLDALGDDDWSMITHPSRVCIYDEGNYSASLTWRYDPTQILPQIEYYRSIGHPAQWGLFATGANIRRHTSIVEKICDQWWWENTTRSHQDQLSLPVLTRLAGDEFKWNTNMPWHQWWHLAEHGW